MSNENTPLPPQNPEESNVDVAESSLATENSEMESSVIYHSDRNSPSPSRGSVNCFKPNRIHILPNLHHPLICTHQNLPPMSSTPAFKKSYKNDAALKDTQSRKKELLKEPVAQVSNFTKKTVSKPRNQQYSNRRDIFNDSGFKESRENVDHGAKKTRSQTNMLHPYINVLEFIEKLCNHGNRNTYDCNKNVMLKPQQVDQEPRCAACLEILQSVEIFVNGFQPHALPGLNQYVPDFDSNAAETIRVFHMLVEENKRLQKILGKNNIESESVVKLKERIQKLQSLYDDLSMRKGRQELLDLQLKQALSQDSAITNIVTSSSSDRNNIPKKLRETTGHSSQTILSSSPIITQTLTEDSLGERTLGLESNQTNLEPTRNANELEQNYNENEVVENWREQAARRARHHQRTPDEIIIRKVMQALKDAKKSSSPFYGRHGGPVVIDCKSPSKKPASNLLVNQSASSTGNRPRMARNQPKPQQQQPIPIVTISSHSDNEGANDTSNNNLPSCSGSNAK